MPGMTPELFQKAATRLATLDGLLMSLDAALRAEVDGLKSDVLACGDIALIHALFPQRGDFERLSGDALSKAYLTRQTHLLTAAIRDSLLPGVSDPLSFAAYYNTGAGGPYRCLLPAAFGDAYTRLTTLSFRPADLLPPPAMHMGQRSVGGALAPGRGINGEKYAGATSPILTASATALSQSRSAAAGLVIVTGKARNRNGDIYDGAEFSGDIDADGEVGLTPSDVGDLLLSVTGITLPPNMTAGTVIVSSQSGDLP